MLKALLVNDDGYKAAGIRALQQRLIKDYEVTAVAPATEQSWMGKSITGYRDLTLQRETYHEFDGYTVDGTPADCTQIGLYEVLHEKPDFVISGINQGSNVGHSYILSSGTVGAALEAGLQGIPAFAVSAWHLNRTHPGRDFTEQSAVELFETISDITAEIIEKIMTAGFPKDVQVVAINMPQDVKRDARWVVTRPHRESYGKLFANFDGKIKNVGSDALEAIDDKSTDLAALLQGYVSIVPIAIELTSDAGQRSLADSLGISILH